MFRYKKSKRDLTVNIGYDIKPCRDCTQHGFYLFEVDSKLTNDAMRALHDSLVEQIKSGVVVQDDSIEYIGYKSIKG